MCCRRPLHLQPVAGVGTPVPTRWWHGNSACSCSLSNALAPICLRDYRGASQHFWGKKQLYLRRKAEQWVPCKSQLLKTECALACSGSLTSPQRGRNTDHPGWESQRPQTAPPAKRRAVGAASSFAIVNCLHLTSPLSELLSPEPHFKAFIFAPVPVNAGQKH